MRPVLTFLRSHGYELFITSLVLALGVASRQLRHNGVAVEAAAISTPSPTAVPSASPTATPIPERTWLRPVSGGILTPYADAQPLWNADMDCWQTHAAVDLAAAPDEPVLAAADGLVLTCTDDPLLGLTVTLDHGDGFISRYSSLSTFHCTPGDRIHAGESLGAAGNSADSEALLGTHLHFELLRNDIPVKPIFN